MLNVRVALPTIIRAWDEALVSRWIKACADAGIRDFEVGNVGAFKYLENGVLNQKVLALISHYMP